MTKAASVHVKIDDRVKTDAAAVLKELGLTLSDAVRSMLGRIAEDGELPVWLKAPNDETRAAMHEADTIVKRRAARFDTAQDLLDALEEDAAAEAKRPAA